MSVIRENLEKLEVAIEAACVRAGRLRASVELMAVSKTYPAADLLAARESGLLLFGENRVQEFDAKAAELGAARAGVRVHLIGHLQSNKTAKAAEVFDAVDSLDSVKLAERLEDAAARLDKKLPVLVEVKLSDEGSKAGIEPDSPELPALMEALKGYAHVRVEGLMTIAPLGVGEAATRACFRRLRGLRDEWAARYALDLPVLSMGMSGDFAWAIEEGATRIRVGTALFGARSYESGHVAQ